MSPRPSRPFARLLRRVRLAARLAVLAVILAAGSACSCAAWSVEPALGAASLVGWSLLGYLVAEGD